MGNRILRFINHRDVVLLLALVVGLALGDQTRILSEYAVWILAIVMLFSTTGFTFRSWIPFRGVIKDIVKAVFLNYIVFGLIVVLATSFIPDAGDYSYLRKGLFIIVAAPAGPSIIAFTALLKGNLEYSVNGVFGITVASLFLTPLLLFLLLDGSEISPLLLMPMLLKLIVLPLVISRFLRHKKIFPVVKKAQPTIVKWGFFFVIVPTVGLSRDVIFAEPQLVLIAAAVFMAAIYVLGFLYYLIARKKENPRNIISGILITVVKSSAFSAVVAFSFFEESVVALPSAVLSIFVTSFYITFSLFAGKFLKSE